MNFRQEAIVKKAIIAYGRKIARLELKEISEKTNVDTHTILKIVKSMIKNKEIFGEYFKSSKTIAFNQIKNVENIDNLMELYNNWENNKLKKK